MLKVSFSYEKKIKKKKNYYFFYSKLHKLTLKFRESELRSNCENTKAALHLNIYTLKYIHEILIISTFKTNTPTTKSLVKVFYKCTKTISIN